MRFTQKSGLFLVLVGVTSLKYQNIYDWCSKISSLSIKCMLILFLAIVLDELLFEQYFFVLLKILGLLSLIMFGLVIAVELVLRILEK